jgi:hypothetical protein
VSGNIRSVCLERSDRPSGSRTHIVVMWGIIHTGPVPQVGRDRHLRHSAASVMTTSMFTLKMMLRYIRHWVSLQLLTHCTMACSKIRPWSSGASSEATSRNSCFAAVRPPAWH